MHWLNTDFYFHQDGTVHPLQPNPPHPYPPQPPLWSALHVAMPTGTRAPLDAPIKCLFLNFTHVHTTLKWIKRSVCVCWIEVFRSCEPACAPASMLHGEIYKQRLRVTYVSTYLGIFHRVIHILCFQWLLQTDADIPEIFQLNTTSLDLTTFCCCWYDYLHHP